MAEKYVKGLDQIARNMRELPDKLAKKHLRKAVLAGAYAVRDAARAGAPVRTGKLKQNIIVKFIPERSNKYQATYFVIARSGYQFQKMKKRTRGFDVTTGTMATFTTSVNNDAYYWRFIEFGTAKMDAQPFMRPAFEQKKDRALGLITAYLKAGVDQSVRAFSKNYVLPN